MALFDPSCFPGKSPAEQLQAIYQALYNISAGSGDTDPAGTALDPIFANIRKLTAVDDAVTATLDAAALAALETITVAAITGALPAGTALIGKFGIDQTTPGSTDSVTVKSAGYSASATFTPAATSHLANDANGAAAEIDFNAIAASRVMITSATLEIDGATAEVTGWKLYLYNVTPPSATADDGAWDLPSGDRASFLGLISLGTAVDLGSTQWVETNSINKQIKLAGDSVFAYLVNDTTLTPAAVAHKVTLHAVAV